MPAIRSHRELPLYKTAFAAACLILTLSKKFPALEKYDAFAQVRASCRSVCANIAEAWRKRIYPASFISKLVDAEAEAAETQVWMEFALTEQYISQQEFDEVFDAYEQTLAQCVTLRGQANKWKPPSPLIP